MEPDTQNPQTDASVSEVSTDNNTGIQEGAPEDEAPSFGWNDYAEKINGRFAMVGFAALLVLELLTHQDFFTWLGF